jgi:hypothetical protein
MEIYFFLLLKFLSNTSNFKTNYIIKQCIELLAENSDVIRLVDRTRFHRTALEEAEHNAALQSIDHFVTFDADLNWLKHNGYRTNRRSKEEISCFLFKALQPMIEWW